MKIDLDASLISARPQIQITLKQSDVLPEETNAIPKVEEKLTEPRLDPHARTDTCTTAGCARAAVDMLSSMDRTVDPCEDFYEFACGQWNKLHPIPEDESHYGTFKMVQKRLQVQLRSLLEEDRGIKMSNPIEMVKTLFQTCMDTGNSPS